MTELFLPNGHLSDEGLQALVAGTLDEMQRLEAAEHLSFCDECLVRYTDALTQDVQLEPEQNVTLPVMRKLRNRATKQLIHRYTAAVAAVVVTGALWYSGVFTGVMDSINLEGSHNMIAFPSASQTNPENDDEQSSDAFSNAWKALNQWIYGKDIHSPKQINSSPSVSNNLVDKWPNSLFKLS